MILGKLQQHGSPPALHNPRLCALSTISAGPTISGLGLSRNSERQCGGARCAAFLCACVGEIPCFEYPRRRWRHPQQSTERSFGRRKKLRCVHSAALARAYGAMVQQLSSPSARAPAFELPNTRSLAASSRMAPTWRRSSSRSPSEIRCDGRPHSGSARPGFQKDDLRTRRIARLGSIMCRSRSSSRAPISQAA